MSKEQVGSSLGGVDGYLEAIMKQLGLREEDLDDVVLEEEN
jgi:hypothetical protein